MINLEPPGNADRHMQLQLPLGAVDAHLGHGDTLGPCVPTPPRDSAEDGAEDGADDERGRAPGNPPDKATKGGRADAKGEGPATDATHRREDGTQPAEGACGCASGSTRYPWLLGLVLLPLRRRTGCRRDPRSASRRIEAPPARR